MTTQHGRSATKATPSPPSDGKEDSLDRRTWIAPAHEPSFGARPVSGRSGSVSLLVPELSPGRRLHSDPLRAGTSRAPDAGGFRDARRVQSLGNSRHDPFVLVLGQGRGAVARGGPRPARCARVPRHTLFG